MSRIALFALLLAVLAGCGASASPTSQSAAAPTSTTSAAATPTAGAAQSGAAIRGATVDQLATGLLAGHLGVGGDAVKVVKREQVDWPDSSLGCPDPAAMYMQVITPGYRLTVDVAGKTYDVHSNEDGSSLVLCDNGKPVQVKPTGR